MINMSGNDQKFINIRSVLSILMVIFAIAAIICLNFWYGKEKASAPNVEISSFEECVAAGNPIMESYPAQCLVPNGKTFTQETAPNVLFELSKVFGEKYEKPLSEVHVTLVDEREAHFRGKYWLGPEKEGEGESFFALKNGDAYEIFFDGSSGYTCQMLKELGFPEEMQEGCSEGEKGEGVIKGKVTMASVCLAEQKDPHCPAADKIYASRTLVIHNVENEKEVVSAPVSPDGTYEFALLGGKYVMDMKRFGLESSPELPHEFTLASGQVLEFDISIDVEIK